MTIEQFWSIVEKVQAAADGDMDKKCELLGVELRRLPLEEVRSFHAHFYECLDRAYNWELWAGAYVMGSGCGDDAFSDFRSTLISMGRETFERALADPESLADMDYDAENAYYEGYQYVPTAVECELNGGLHLPRSRTHPEEPSGRYWDDDNEVAKLYPKLAKKYKYKG
jgi:hypothetical protein